VWECLAFLADQTKADRIYVAFAFDYDVTMMLRQVGQRIWNKLLNRSGRERIVNGKPTGQYWPVEVGEFEIDYMPHKEFKVRRKGSKYYTVIHDTFTFFQSSFVVALKKWFPEEEWAKAIDKIAEGKEMRHDFGAVTEYEREYNKLEIVMLQRLLNRFRDMCYGLDIRPRKWQGPGHLVNAVFAREGVPRKDGLSIPSEVWSAANLGYVAGRFEAGTYGEVEEKVYQYDINSAYASYYKKLPCLLHGEWQEISRLPISGTQENPTYLVEVSFRHPEGYRWNTLPVRSNKGSILFPREGRGWYWSTEIEVARKWGVEMEMHKGFLFVEKCGCQPFDWVYELYDERDRRGKTSGYGKVLKIVLATIYGKLAQSIGNPVYANPIWAGLITSNCRARLIDATLSVRLGEGVHMLATDGLFTSDPIPGLPIGRSLGEWELTEHQDGMFIVQSGVYFAGEEKPKTRGVPMSKIIKYEMHFRYTWHLWCINGGDIAVVSIPLRIFIGIRVARAWRKPGLAGQWLEREKRVRFDWTTKRERPRQAGKRVVTMPVSGGAELVSVGPRRGVGGVYDGLDAALEDAPDWADQLLWDEDI